MQLRWKVDECSNYGDRMRLRGWCFVPGRTILELQVRFPTANTTAKLVSFGLPSPDVAAAIHPDAGHARFDEWVAVPDEQRGRDFCLVATFPGGIYCETDSVHDNARSGDPAHACWYHFLDRLNALPAGRVLEIGSRARSAITRRELISSKLDYVGFDILAGTNVDVVGDAHELSRAFPAGSFAAVFSLSTFEHLAMPWKVVVEMNRILAPGGLAFVNTQQSWPVHEEPWDFWRFTKHAWRCLFNEATGYEIIEVAHGEPARIHPLWDAPVLRDMPASPAYLASNVIARKIGETRMDWAVPREFAAPECYPTGELSAAPH